MRGGAEKDKRELRGVSPSGRRLGTWMRGEDRLMVDVTLLDEDDDDGNDVPGR